MLSFEEAFHVYRVRFLSFDGRASRSEFWWIVSLLMLIKLLSTILLPWIGFIPFLLVNIITVALSSSVTARRLHDRGHSAWLVLLYIAPLGDLILLIMCAFKGHNGHNQYGTDPLKPGYYEFYLNPHSESTRQQDFKKVAQALNEDKP